jgi:hypothetical protein
MNIPPQKFCRISNSVALSRAFAMTNSNNRSDKCAPERGNEPPAQGNTLENLGNITDGALTGHKRYR